MNLELPENCRTKLECRTCKSDHFWVCWNWTPVGEDGNAAAPRWEMNCAWCREMWLLDPGGLPNPEEIHGAQVDVRLFQRPGVPLVVPSGGDYETQDAPERA